jgi:hypothetical protein
MHWESVHVARRLPLARGWETQLDVKYNPLFRRGRELTSERYQHWLHANGVRYVALPAVPLDPAARQEARLIRRACRSSGGSGRTATGSSSRSRTPADWPAATPGCGGSARPRSPWRPAGGGPHPVRVRWTPYWRLTAGEGCVERGVDGWTTVIAERPGVIRVSARFDPERIVRRGPLCRSR